MTDARWSEMEKAYSESAIHRALGLSLRVRAAGEVSVTFDGSESAGNRARGVAGGALATMVDSAVVQAVRTMLVDADRTATIDLSVSFVRAGTVGQELTATGRADHVGGSLAVGRAIVVDGAGEVVALGMVTVSIKRAGTEKARKVEP